MSQQDDTRIVLPCEEFSEFKEALEGARKLDDRIIYKLNTSIPTTSFAGEVSATDQCKSLYQEVKLLHQNRRAAIQRCVDVASENLLSLRDKMRDDDTVIRKVRNEQNKLRLMRNELTVEDVVKQRTLKVFKERCWQAYKPPDL